MITNPPRATIDDLAKVDGNAELIGGRIVRHALMGSRPSLVSGYIYRKLADYVDGLERGRAHPFGVGFVVPELDSGRESFSPDVSFIDLDIPIGEMGFIRGAPKFAVEVRSEGDRKPATERRMAAKRRDYFEAGTLVVWDVDPVASVVRVHRRDRPDSPAEYGRDDLAEAEPALPGWRLPLRRAFE